MTRTNVQWKRNLRHWGAEDAIIYSSGMAAIVGVLMSRLNQVMRSFSLISGIIVAESLPSIFQIWSRDRQVKTGDFEAMEDAINSKTKMLVSESQPHLAVTTRSSSVLKKHNVETLIDATLATLQSSSN